MRARMLTLFTVLLLTLGLAAQPIAASAADAGPAAVAAAKKKPKKKAKKKKAKAPTAKQCTKKAIRKLKGKKRKQRQAACAKRKKKKKSAPKRSGDNRPPSRGDASAGSGSSSSTGSSAKPAGPFDYTKLDLTQPKHAVTKQELMLPMPDGREVYIEVVRPKAPGRYGVILEASGYHGTLYNREGWRILPQPTKPGKNEPQGLTGYFAPRGYAVVMMDLRGTGKSQGCLDHLGQKDAVDLKTVVEWAAKQDWSNGRVGMLGHSYVGSTPNVAAAQNPKGLVTVVSSAGLASMYDHQYQAGVPWNLQWAGPVIGYQGLAIARALPEGTGNPVTEVALGTDVHGDNFGNDPQEAACGLPQNALVSNESMLSGQYVGYHRERDHTEGAKKWDGDYFIVHGVNDEAARIASLHWYNERGTRGGDKVWIGQWDHGIGCCPNRRGMQWTAALHAWFDSKLLGRDVETGPRVELFLNSEPTDTAAIQKQSEVLQPSAWPPRGTEPLTLFARADKSLGEAATGDGTNTFAADPNGYAQNRYAAGSVEFRSEPFKRDVLIAGVPKLSLALSQTVERLHSVVNLIDESPNGNLRRISTCALQPELRSGLNTIQPVIPAQRMDLAPPCFAMAHHLKAGHRLRLKVAASDDDHVPTFAIDPRVTVFSGKEATRITLPTVDDRSRLFRDSVDLKAKGFGGSGA